MHHNPRENFHREGSEREIACQGGVEGKEEN